MPCIQSHGYKYSNNRLSELNDSTVILRLSFETILHSFGAVARSPCAPLFALSAEPHAQGVQNSTLSRRHARVQRAGIRAAAAELRAYGQPGQAPPGAYGGLGMGAAAGRRGGTREGRGGWGQGQPESGVQPKHSADAALAFQWMNLMECTSAATPPATMRC